MPKNKEISGWCSSALLAEQITRVFTCIHNLRKYELRVIHKHWKQLITI